MMRPSHLAAQGAGLVDKALREIAESFAAGIQLVRLGLTWFALHVTLGALIITKLVLLAGRGGPASRSRHGRPNGRVSER